jgi:hypothetical protein
MCKNFNFITPFRVSFVHLYYTPIFLKSITKLGIYKKRSNLQKVGERFSNYKVIVITAIANTWKIWSTMIVNQNVFLIVSSELLMMFFLHHRTKALRSNI